MNAWHLHVAVGSDQMRSPPCGSYIHGALDYAFGLMYVAKGHPTLKAEIAETQVQLKRAGEDREKENHRPSTCKKLG